MEQITRNIFLSLSKSKSINKFAKKHGLRFGAQRFVAGETIQQAISVIQQLNKDGRVVTLDHLGEFVNNEKEADVSTEMCLKALDAIHEANVESHLSVKLTSLGLDIDKELCLRNIRRILDRARQYGIFVRIDMEDFAHCQITIDIYHWLRNEYDNVGLVIQAYLYRSEDDVKQLNELRANLRLVKGAYKESPKVAFPAKKDVDENFRKLLKMHLANGNYTAIATHDESVVNDMIAFIKEKGISDDLFEFQMLYGIREDLQKRLVKEGYRVRVYLPFGVDWFGYFMRRLAERPANVWFILKNLFK